MDLTNLFWTDFLVQGKENNMNEKDEIEMKEEKVVEIAMERLHPFENHPFKIKQDDQMKDLQESVVVPLSA